MPTLIQRHEILIGHPLLSDVRDRNNILLARAGWVVENERERDALFARRAYWATPVRPLTPDSVKDELPLIGAKAPRVYEFLNYRLERISRNVETISNFESYLFDLVKVIRDSLSRQYDALLAQVMLGAYPRYSIRHAIDTAILVEAMGIESGHPVGVRNTMTCAALTMNISMLEMQDKLRDIAGELPESVLAMVKEHPKRSVGMLKKAGITNQSWLTAVDQHHERLDGAGYPKGLRDQSISLEAQFVAAADVLLARMAPAAYKGAETPAKAFWGAYESRGVDIRQDALTAAIKAMGLYPPGTLVRLANYDLAVVISRGKEISKPIAASIVGERGLVLPSPLPRDTSDEDYAVAAVVDPARVGLTINTDVLWPG